LQPERYDQLKERVVSAAEAALAHKQYVSAIDVLTGSRLLEPAHVESWRKGRIDFLERAIQANLKKISQSMAMFRQWALEKGLKPTETHYVAGRATGLWICDSARAAIPLLRRTIALTMSPPPCLSANKGGSRKN
jgi:hypothetical protein